MKEKIPFYNIVNMFFVGSVFIFIVAVLFHGQFKTIDLSAPIFSFLKDWSIVISAILLIAMYEVGFVLNRASSVIIEPILTKTKIWPKYQYDKDVSEISEKNSKFQSMITELVLMRTHILLYIIIAALSLFSPYKWFALLCVALVILFVLAGRKHNSKVNIIRKSTVQSQSIIDNRNKETSSFLHYDGSAEEEKNDTTGKTKN